MPGQAFSRPFAELTPGIGIVRVEHHGHADVLSLQCIFVSKCADVDVCTCSR